MSNNFPLSVHRPFIEAEQIPAGLLSQPQKLRAEAEVRFNEIGAWLPSRDGVFRTQGFDHFLSENLMPNSAELRKSTWYWRTVLELLRNAISGPNGLAHVKAMAEWVQKAFDRPAFHQNGSLGQLDMDEVFVTKLWSRLSPNCECPYRAAMRAGILDGLDRGQVVDPMTIDWALRLFDSPGCQRVGPSAGRLGHAWQSLGFAEMAVPVLVMRFGMGPARKIWRDSGRELFGLWLGMQGAEGGRELVGRPVFSPDFFQDQPFSLLLSRFPAFALTILGNRDKLPEADAAHIFSGKSFRDLPVLARWGKVRLSPKAAHFLQNEPSLLGLPLIHAVIYSRALTLCPNRELAKVFADSEQFSVWIFEPFFEETMHFFNKNGADIPGNSCRTVLDFLNNKRRHNPNFSLRGRTGASVRRLTEEWHAELAAQKVAASEAKKWARVPIMPFVSRNQVGQVFVIKQIDNMRELAEEGAALRHCVASYADGCMAGKWSIWSLREIKNEAEIPLVTIEVQSRRALQSRGLSNRPPKDHELILIKEWCRQERLIWVGG